MRSLLPLALAALLSLPALGQPSSLAALDSILVSQWQVLYFQGDTTTGHGWTFYRHKTTGYFARSFSSVDSLVGYPFYEVFEGDSVWVRFPLGGDYPADSGMPPPNLPTDVTLGMKAEDWEAFRVFFLIRDSLLTRYPRP